MIELSVTKKASAPAEVVYDLISDLPRMGEWSPENVGGEWRDGATGPAVGARFAGRNQRKAGWTTTVTITEATRGVSFAFVTGKVERPETRWSYQLTPTPEGCEVTETCQILREPGPVGQWLTKLGTGVKWADRPEDMRRGVEETLRRLAEAAEDAGRVRAEQG